MPQRENLLDVVGLLLRRWRLIAGISAAAFVLCVVISLLLPVYYQASTVFLAASPDQTNPSKIYSSQAELNVFGSGNDIERVIGIANSEETVSFLIDSFDLFTVYEIDPNKPKARFKVREAFFDVYSVTRTRYDQIELAFEDQDPTRAAAIANAARKRIEFVLRDLTEQSRQDMIELYQRSLTAKNKRKKILRDSLQRLALLYGIVDVEAQGEELSGLLGRTDREIISDSIKLASLKRSGRLKDSIAVVEARIASAKGTKAEIIKQLKLFSEGSSEVFSLKTETEMLAIQLSQDQEHLRQMESLSSKTGTVIHLVDKAQVPDSKSRPVRWLIVVGGVLIAIILSILGVIVYDNYKHVEWRNYLHE